MKRATISPDKSLKLVIMFSKIRLEVTTLLVSLGTIHLLARLILIRGWQDSLGTFLVNFTLWPLCFMLCLWVTTELQIFQEQHQRTSPLPWIVGLVLFGLLTWLRFSA